MRQIAAVPPEFRDGIIKDRLAGNQRFGMGFRGLKEPVEIAGIVLPVGIDLQGMAIAPGPGGDQSGFYRVAFTPVDLMANHAHPGFLGCQRLQCGGAVRRAAIVHQQAGQPIRLQPGQQPSQRRGMVIHGYDDTGPVVSDHASLSHDRSRRAVGWMLPAARRIPGVSSKTGS